MSGILGGGGGGGVFLGGLIFEVGHQNFTVCEVFF